MIARQNKIIIGIISLLLIITVGYALFSESININGTAKASGDFNLIFNEVKGKTEKGSENASANIVNGGKNLSINVPKLKFPTAYAEFTVIIKNVGNITARLIDIKTLDLNDNNIKVSYVNIAPDGVIKPDEEKEMKIRVEWLESSTTPSTNSTFKIELIYEQLKPGESPDSPGSSEIIFPVVSGQLGDNVFYTYDNGYVNITGSGPMWSGKNTMDSACINGDDSYCSLILKLGFDMMNPISKGNEKIKPYLNMIYLKIGGMSFDEILHNMFGVSTEEELKNMLKATNQYAPGFTDDEADFFIKVLKQAPSINNINIADGITTIREYFLDYIKKDIITIPNSITFLGERFLDGSRLDVLELGSGVSKLTFNSFNDNDSPLSTSIKKIIIPNGINEIEQRTFTEIEDIETIVNKTGKAFDWNGILTGTSGQAFETGTVTRDGKTITITK